MDHLKSMEMTTIQRKHFWSDITQSNLTQHLGDKKIRLTCADKTSPKHSDQNLNKGLDIEVNYYGIQPAEKIQKAVKIDSISLACPVWYIYLQTEVTAIVRFQ